MATANWKGTARVLRSAHLQEKQSERAADIGVQPVLSGEQLTYPHSFH
jgi:hypothetical protein